MLKTDDSTVSYAARVEADGEEIEVWRWEKEIPPLDLLEWLSMFEAYSKFYWENPTGDLKIAAIGKEWQVKSVPKFNENSQEVRFYGAQFFDAECDKDPLWKNFGACSFFLPTFEIVQKDSITLFAINHIKENKKPFVLPPFAKSKISSLKISNRSDVPSFERWETKVQEALKAIKNKELQKVVLARQVSFQSNGYLDPIMITQKLGRNRKNSYLFLYQISPDEAFIGASPEQLYLRDQSLINSNAIAGTRKRGKTQFEDEAMQKELLYSSKELSEFLYVREFLVEKLASYCKSHELQKSISILQTASVQHLYSAFSGKLKKGVKDEDLISALHPTPATLGVPRQEAFNFLKKQEDFKRGLYAGPIGWISPQKAEIVVALRSCLIQDQKVHLYSGVGIVDGSDPILEWEELESKISPFLRDVFL